MWVGTEKRIEKNVFVAYEKKNIINKKERRIEFCKSGKKVWNEPKYDI